MVSTVILRHTHSDRAPAGAALVPNMSPDWSSTTPICDVLTPRWAKRKPTRCAKRKSGWRAPRVAAAAGTDVEGDGAEARVARRASWMWVLTLWRGRVGRAWPILAVSFGAGYHRFRQPGKPNSIVALVVMVILA